jgi:hypothetical protein
MVEKLWKKRLGAVKCRSKSGGKPAESGRKRAVSARQICFKGISCSPFVADFLVEEDKTT